MKNGTSDSRKDWFAIGAYKKLPNEVGGSDTALPEEVGDKMKALLTEYNAKEEKTFEDILDFHVKFERIHPFQDGNGRVGRLIMFKECLKYNIVPFIIEDNLKMFYYRGLKEWDNKKGYLTDICLTAQYKYKAYLDYFRIAHSAGNGVQLCRKTRTGNLNWKNISNRVNLVKLKRVKHGRLQSACRRWMVGFASDIWQIHPFCEGNTRATAVFMIKYMKTFGFKVNSDAFEKNSRYFRNALVRANYNDLQNGIHATTKFLEMFFSNLILGTEYDNSQSVIPKVPKSQFDTLECTLEELAVLRLIYKNPSIKQKELAAETGRSLSTVVLRRPPGQMA